METTKNKRIWLIALVLLIAAIISAAFYVSNIKEMAPTESEDVIALVPEDEKDTEETDGAGTQDANGDDAAEETTKIDVPKSSLKNGAKSTGGVRTEKRQVGLLEADMTVEDKNRVWSTMTEVDIFRKAYEGTQAAGTANEYTVENGLTQDARNLIAPGTENDYVFWVKNTGQVGIDYCIWFDEHDTYGYEIPLEVRVKHGNKYILGSEEKWEPISRLDHLEHEGHLSVKHYAQYTLEWRWPFEEDDVRDTYLGDEAVKNLIEQEITIYTYGEGYDRPIYEIFSVAGVKTGDSANILLWIVLLIIAIAAVYYIQKKKKRDEKEGE